MPILQHPKNKSNVEIGNTFFQIKIKHEKKTRKRNRHTSSLENSGKAVFERAASESLRQAERGVSQTDETSSEAFDCEEREVDCDEREVSRLLSEF